MSLQGIPNPINLSVECDECSKIMLVIESFRSNNYYFTLHHFLGLCKQCLHVKTKSICVNREGELMNLDNLEEEIDKIDKIKRFTAADVRKLREMTGCGMLKCKEALNKAGSAIEAIKYLRSIGQEPTVDGLADTRIDVLQNDAIVAQFETMKELRDSEYTSLNSKIRFVDSMGHYSYVK